MKARLIAALLLSLSAGAVQAEPQQPARLKCEIGPVQRQFGGTDWLVYSCDDERSMVIISRASNPAAPFYFILVPKDGTYQIHGEGSGSKAASDAAGAELSALKPDALAALLAETKMVPAADH